MLLPSGSGLGMSSKPCVKPSIRSISELTVRELTRNFSSGFRNTTVMRLLAMLAFAILSGCAAQGSVQNNPSANQKIVYASAYSTEGCQAEMNDLAQNEVRMVSDDQRLATSIFSFGIVPAHQCIGIVKDTLAVAPAPTKHE
jgi:hypothetical protein